MGLGPRGWCHDPERAGLAVLTMGRTAKGAISLGWSFWPDAGHHPPSSPSNSLCCRLAAPNRLRAAPCQSSPTPVVGPTPPMQDHPHHLLVHIGWPTGASYPTPSNLSYFWGLGSLAAICFSAMMATGGLLATGYLPLPPVAFFSVERISRSVPSGWLSRCLHGCGASAFLAVVHLHLFRGWGRIPSPAR